MQSWQNQQQQQQQSQQHGAQDGQFAFSDQVAQFDGTWDDPANLQFDITPHTTADQTFFNPHAQSSLTDLAGHFSFPDLADHHFDAAAFDNLSSELFDQSKFNLDADLSNITPTPHHQQQQPQHLQRQQHPQHQTQQLHQQQQQQQSQPQPHFSNPSYPFAEHAAAQPYNAAATGPQFTASPQQHLVAPHTQPGRQSPHVQLSHPHAPPPQVHDLTRSYSPAHSLNLQQSQQQHQQQQQHQTSQPPSFPTTQATFQPTYSLQPPPTQFVQQQPVPQQQQQQQQQRQPPHAQPLAPPAHHPQQHQTFVHAPQHVTQIPQQQQQARQSEVVQQQPHQTYIQNHSRQVQQQQQQHPQYASANPPAVPQVYHQTLQNVQPHHHQQQRIATPQNSQSHIPTTMSHQLQPNLTQQEHPPPPHKRQKTMTERVATSNGTFSAESTPDHTGSPASSVGGGGISTKPFVEGVTAFPVPSSTDHERALVNQFKQRKPAEKVMFPPIKGAPFLVQTGTIRLPTPKSHDKLAPLVAMPSRSGKAIMPDQPGDLACEIQGRFTYKYKPVLVIKTGLDERKAEANVLLTEFERDMKKLAKRRPKYTEYPHAFKEQLKSDESTKLKAVRKAKKELEGGDKGRPIRSEIRPADPSEAAAWDMTGIIHIDPSATRTHALIAGAVQSASELIVKLRGEMIRARQDVDQAIKDNVPDKELVSLNRNLEAKKAVIFKALDAANEYGDDTVLENLGGHQKLVATLINILISCTKLKDFSGKLPKVVLELMTNFIMTEATVESTRFGVIMQKFAEKGDDEVKEYLTTIKSRIQKAAGSDAADNKKRPEKAASPVPSTSAVRRLAGTTTTTGNNRQVETSTKRSREDDSGELRVIKKIAVESSSPAIGGVGGNSLLGRKLGAPKPGATSSLTSKVLSAKPLSSSGSTLLPGKTARPVAKPISKVDPKASLSGLDDRSAKPDAAATRRALLAKSEPSQGGSSSALSGIASLLDSINAPKPELTSSSHGRDEHTPEINETAEEKAKRLRKESRKKLRVKWKEGDDLVEVRIFHKAATEEDESKSHNMVRDAADDKSEGMVLKQRANVAEDEDDDDDIPYQPWVAPTKTDFSSIAQDIRAVTFTRRGGEVAIETGEQKYIAEREQRELMAIYPDPSDIPPTPKSPAPDHDSAAAVAAATKVANLPFDGHFEEIHRRWKESSQFGSQAAGYYAAKRLESKSTNVASTPATSSSVSPATTSPKRHVSATPGVWEEQILALLNSEKAKKWHGSASEPVLTSMPTDPSVVAAFTYVAGISNELANLSHPPSQPPVWMKSEAKIKEWQAGYNRDMARIKKEAEDKVAAEAAAAASAAAIAAAAASATPTTAADMSRFFGQAAGAAPSAGMAPGSMADWAQYLQQQQQQAAYMAIFQQMQGIQPQQQAGAAAAAAAAPTTLDNAQLQAIMAQLQGQPAPPPSSAHAPPAVSAAQPGAALLGLNPNDPTLALLQQLQSTYNVDTAAAGSGGDAEMFERGGERGGSGGGTTKKVTLAPHRPANVALIGTKACTFWRQGKCARGDKCTFRHD